MLAIKHEPYVDRAAEDAEDDDGERLRPGKSLGRDKRLRRSHQGLNALAIVNRFVLSAERREPHAPTLSDNEPYQSPAVTTSTVTTANTERDPDIFTRPRLHQ